MATAKWSAASSESADVAGTAINSIASGSATAVIADIDNTTNKDLYISFWLVLGSITPAAGGSVTLRLRRKRSSTYDDASATIYQCENLTKPLTTGAGAKNVAFSMLRLNGPFVFGVDLVNNSGVTTASSGNSLYYQTFDEDVS